MISPPRNRVGTVADAVSRSDLLPRADSGAVLREHELRVVRCRYPLCPWRDCHPKDASAFGPPIRRISPGKVPLRNGRRTQIWSATFKDQQPSPGRSSQHVVTGRWLFSFAVSAPRPLPPADVGRAISARGREGSFCTFSTSQVVTMLRAYASRVGGVK